MQKFEKALNIIYFKQFLCVLCDNSFKIITSKINVYYSHGE